MTLALHPPIRHGGDVPCCLHSEDHDRFTCELLTAMTEPIEPPPTWTREDIDAMGTHGVLMIPDRMDP